MTATAGTISDVRLDDVRARRERMAGASSGSVTLRNLGCAPSIDDFVITCVVSGSTTTSPLFVWGAARVPVPSQVNVIASAISSWPCS